MTVNTTNIISGPYPGNGVTDTFSYTFRVENKNQLRVYEIDDNGVTTELTVDVNYTVNTVGDDAGGTITRVAGALPTDYQWYIRSNYQPTQVTSFTSQGAFFPLIHETAMDKLTFLIQQLYDSVARTIRLSDSSLATAPVLTDPEPLKYLRINAAGNGVEYAAGILDALSTQTEVKVLTDGQLEVFFTNVTLIASFYLVGDEVDNGRLELGTDFTVDHIQKKLTLNQSYPAGTRLIMVFYEGEALLPNGLNEALTFNTVAEMTASSLSAGQVVHTKGYYDAGDDGGGLYVVQTPTDFVDTPDEYGDHTLANGNIAALQSVNGRVNVRQYGAYHDETLFGAPVAAADQSEFFDAAALAGREVDVPEGDYKVAVALTNEAIWNIHPGCNIADAAGLTQPATGLYNTANFTGFIRIWAKRPQAGTGSVLNSKSSLRQGDPELYEITKTGHADSTTSVIVGVGYNGGAGGHFAAHTENNPTNGALQNAISVYGIQDKDNTGGENVGMTSLYVEGIRYPNTYSNPCMEVNSKNFGNTAVATALGNVANATWGVQYISGGQHPDEVSQGGTLTFNPSSFAMGVIGDGVGTTRPGWDKGIIFFIDSISGTDKLAIEAHVDHSFAWRAAGGAIEARIGNGLHRLTYGNDNTAVNTSERVFWRYRGAPNSRAVTLTGDYLGRTSYHGHQASTGGFATGATNAVVTTEGIQDGAVSGANAAGKYSVRLNDGAGAMPGVDFLPARIRPTGDAAISVGSAANRFNEGFIKDLKPGAGTVTWTSGTGTPEGVVTAAVGSMFTRTDGGASTTLYVKESGAGNTGWVAK